MHGRAVHTHRRALAMEAPHRAGELILRDVQPLLLLGVGGAVVAAEEEPAEP